MYASTKPCTAFVAALLSRDTVSVVLPAAARLMVTPSMAPLTLLLALVMLMPSRLSLASVASLAPAVFSLVARVDRPLLLPEPALTLKPLATPVLLELSSSCAPPAPLTTVAVTPGLSLAALILAAMSATVSVAPMAMLALLAPTLSVSDPSPTAAVDA